MPSGQVISTIVIIPNSPPQVVGTVTNYRRRSTETERSEYGGTTGD